MIILIIGSLIILVGILMQRKWSLHVKLLKALYPKDFDKGISHWSMGFRFPVYKLGFLDYYSSAFPIYFFRKKYVLESDLQKELHGKLVRNNLFILGTVLILVLIFILTQP